MEMLSLMQFGLKDILIWLIIMFIQILNTWFTSILCILTTGPSLRSVSCWAAATLAACMSARPKDFIIRAPSPRSPWRRSTMPSIDLSWRPCYVRSRFLPIWSTTSIWSTWWGRARVSFTTESFGFFLNSAATVISRYLPIYPIGSQWIRVSST